jgi:hypothetical protein
MVRFIGSCTFLLLWVCTSVLAQDFDEPTILPPAINSEAEEVMPLMSPDGKALYFARSRAEGNIAGVYGGTDIWVSELMESGWRRASNSLTPFNTSDNEVVVGINRAGNALYYMSTSAGKRVRGLYRSVREKGVWSKGELMVIENIESSGTLSMFVHPDEDILLLSLEASGGQGKQDLYYSTRTTDGSWTKPKSMGVVVNTPGSEISPFLSRTKDKLYFSSNGHEGVGGFDLFVCDRLQESLDTWSVPRNLGKTINTSGFEGYLSIAEDSTILFASAEEGKSSNLLMTRFRKQASTLPVDNRIYIDSEIQSIAGRKLESYIRFENSGTTLNRKNQEDIGQIADVIRYLSAVKVYLVAYELRERSELDLTQKRLLSILDYLKAKGISGDRVTFGFELSTDDSVKDSVGIRFYK